MGAGWRTGRPSISPDTTASARYARNHGTDSRTPWNISAPNGEKRAHSITALPATKPPRLHWSKYGSSRINHSWLKRKRPYRLVRKKYARLSRETTA
jgi:hypothetical protein